MKLRVRIHRLHEIQRIRRDLERDGMPRIQMSLLVALTGIAGFSASYILLHAGFTVMWSRYLLSFGVAYLTFLFLLWVWLRSSADDYIDIADISNAMPSPSASCSTDISFSGNGGNFGGGGASSSFDGSDISSMGDGAGDVIGEAVGGVAQAEEFAVPLFVLIIVLSLLLSTLFMVYSAPALFAELVVDGVLSASLYHRLRGLEARHWLETAIRRTAWPFLLTALIVSVLAWGVSRYVPGAHSIGDVIYHSRHVSQ